MTNFSTVLPVTTRGFIEPGTPCGIDHGWYIWPDIPERYKQPNFSPNMTFTVQKVSDGYEFWADGYGGHINGRPGKYGNGSIFISKSNMKGR